MAPEMIVCNTMQHDRNARNLAAINSIDYKACNAVCCQMIPGESVLHVPEDCSTQVDIVLHEPHASISGPALLVVVPHNVLVVGIGMLGEVALDEILGLLSCEAEHDMHLQCIVSLQHIALLSAQRQQNELSANKAASHTQQPAMHVAW